MSQECMNLLLLLFFCFKFFADSMIKSSILKNLNLCKLIMSSWVLKFELSTQLEKCQIKLKIFWKSIKLNWEVEFKNLNQVEKLDSTIQFKNSIWFNKILDKCK